MLIERRLLAVLFILGSSLLFSAMSSISSKLGSSSSLPPGEIAFFRVFISLIFLFPYLLKRKIPLFGKQKGLIFFRGAAGFISLSLGFFALTKIPIAEVAVLWKSSVVFTAILSVLILKERLTLRLILCTALSLIGAIMILKPGNGFFNIGGLAALGAGIMVAFVSVAIRKLHSTEHSDTIVFGFCFFGSLLGLIFFGHSFVMPNFQQLFLLMVVGITGLFGQILFTRAFLFAPASVVQPLTFAEVLFSASAGFFFFRQIPDWLSILGALAIIISGIGIVSAKKTAVALVDSLE